MKFNLKNRPQRGHLDPELTEWFEEFEKELTEKASKLFQQTRGYTWTKSQKDLAVSELIREILGE